MHLYWLPNNPWQTKPIGQDKIQDKNLVYSYNDNSNSKSLNIPQGSYYKSLYVYVSSVQAMRSSSSKILPSSYSNYIQQKVYCQSWCLIVEI